MSTNRQGPQRHCDCPWPADLNNTIDATALGEFARFLIPAGRFGVVDHVCGSQGLQPYSFLGCCGRRDHPGAQELGELQREDPHTPEPRVRTVSPAVTLRWPVSATQAVTAAHGNVAASSNERWLGTLTSASSPNTAYSASIPSRLAPSLSVR